MKAYIAHSMTGRPGNQLWAESCEAVYYATLYGVQALDPVVTEEVKLDATPLNNSQKALSSYWRRDKEMIREAHVLIDLTGPAKSEGVQHEIGYARYCLWKPVVRVWPKLGPSVAHLEDDVIVEDVNEAMFIAKAYWGTRWKRFKWRAQMLFSSLPKWLYWQLREWK